jgi:biotin operon repressor
MATFLLETGSRNKIAEVTQMLKEEGVEVISFS